LDRILFGPTNPRSSYYTHSAVWVIGVGEEWGWGSLWGDTARDGGCRSRILVSSLGFLADFMVLGIVLGSWSPTPSSPMVRRSLISRVATSRVFSSWMRESFVAIDLMNKLLKHVRGYE
jgi:hypothetical protein